MKKIICMSALLLVALTGPASAAEKEAAAGIERIDKHRVRIGAIEVNKKQGSFRVAGTVLRHDGPLEFLVIAKEGQKAYESFIEVEASPMEFRLASILIGLDEARGKVPRYHFDPEPAQGDRVAITVEWLKDGKLVRANAGDLLYDNQRLVGKSEWVFTGSTRLDEQRFFADMDGTLVGVVHDPASLFEHVKGLGLGSYGNVEAAPDAPPVGASVTLIVKRL